MRKVFLIRCVIMIIPLLGGGGGGMYAQERALREVQVDATRRMKDAGIQQTLLDTTILHQNVAHSMSDILTQHSTLFIKSYGRATESTAEFRGTSPSHTQVLWNGMRINSPMIGTVDFSTIPSYFVDHVRLLHGASSLTVTGGGLGGAVDMHTLPLYNQGYAVQYIQGIGSYGTYDQFLRFTHGGNRWSTSTRAVYSTSRNDFKYTNYDKIGYPVERNRSGYFDDVHVMQDVYYRSPKAGRFGVMLWFTHSLRGLPFLSVDYKENTDFRNEHAQNGIRGVLSWDKSYGKWNLGAHAGYVWQDNAYDYTTTRETVNTDITHSSSISHQGYLQANADWMPRSNWLLTANVSVYYNHVKSEDRSPFHFGDHFSRGRAEFNLNLSAKYRPVQNLTLSAVLREECYRNDFIPVIPAFFAEYQIPGLSSSAKAEKGRRLFLLKASVARNYRYPTLDDLYFKPGGNPNLRPEQGVTYDGGIECMVEHKSFSFRMNLSAFDSYITDWILWTPSIRGYWQPSNLKKVHNYGTEVMATAGLKLRNRWALSLTGNYAYTPSINRSDRLDDNDASYGKQLVYVPLHSANLNGRLSWRTWSLSYQWTCYSERFTTTSNEVSYITGRLKPYYMNDITLEKTFRWRRFHASLKGVVNNLFGTEYVSVLSRPMPGRNFEIFLEIRIK